MIMLEYIKLIPIISACIIKCYYININFQNYCSKNIAISYFYL